MSSDPDWPPDYAKGSDLAGWLAEPAKIGRWVACGSSEVVGHVGLSPVSSDELGLRLAEAARCDLDETAEICRLVVDPRCRNQGLSSLLTRQALRASIEAGLVPVAKVLVNRGSWLAMMVETGWQQVDEVESVGGALVGLLPPERFVEAARQARYAD